jgi:hypothetical protein
MKYGDGEMEDAAREEDNMGVIDCFDLNRLKKILLRLWKSRNKPTTPGWLYPPT